jgi:hypothetical protein
MGFTITKILKKTQYLYSKFVAVVAPNIEKSFLYQNDHIDLCSILFPHCWPLYVKFLKHIRPISH